MVGMVGEDAAQGWEESWGMGCCPGVDEGKEKGRLLCVSPTKAENG